MRRHEAERSAGPIDTAIANPKTGALTPIESSRGSRSKTIRDRCAELVASERKTPRRRGEDDASRAAEQRERTLGQELAHDSALSGANAERTASRVRGQSSERAEGWRRWRTRPAARTPDSGRQHDERSLTASPASSCARVTRNARVGLRPRSPRRSRTIVVIGRGRIDDRHRRDAPSSPRVERLPEGVMAIGVRIRVVVKGSGNQRSDANDGSWKRTCPG